MITITIVINESKEDHYIIGFPDNYYLLKHIYCVSLNVCFSINSENNR